MISQKKKIPIKNYLNQMKQSIQNQTQNQSQNHKIKIKIKIKKTKTKTKTKQMEGNSNSSEVSLSLTSTNFKYLFEKDQITERHPRLTFGIPKEKGFFLKEENNRVVFFDEHTGLPQSLFRSNSYEIVLASSFPFDWENARRSKMDLTKGFGGHSGEKQYIAPNGTVVASSAPVYTNQNFYYLKYLFDGNPSATTHDSYFLSNSSGSQYLLVTFPKKIKLHSIRVCATAYRDNASTDRRSNYCIDVVKPILRKVETPQFENREVEIAVTGNQFIDTSADLHGFMREHTVQSEVQEVRITLTQEKQHGVTLKELEFIVAE